MVKFSKELQAQLIPGWENAFVNYWQLKKHVKKIKFSTKPKMKHSSSYGQSLFDPIRIIFDAITGRKHGRHAETKIVEIKRSIRSEEDEDNPNHLIHLFTFEDEVKLFFEVLDDELSKVNKFYETKEAEFLERGELLHNQLHVLIDLKRVLAHRQTNNPEGGSSHSGSSFDHNCHTSESKKESPKVSETEEDDDDALAAQEKNGVTFINSTKKGKTAPMIWEELQNSSKIGGGEFINGKTIQCAEKMIRNSYVELYKGLGLLRTYSSLNLLAFKKILKKYDKVCDEHASRNYLNLVRRSSFTTSDKVVRLRDEVECLFTQHFANSDRKKAMKFLRPQHSKDSHMVTFFVGLFTGSFIALFSVYAILAHIRGIFFSAAQTLFYMEIVYPFFSMMALLSLHLFMYGCNILMWKRTRINHNYIFDFEANTSLKYRDVFLICTCLMSSVAGAMAMHLFLISSTTFSPREAELIPAFLLLIYVVILICPFNILYRPTRYCFLRIMRNIVLSPFYKVYMVDFFMADQLTSQVPMLRHMESSACYFITRVFTTRNHEICKSGKMSLELSYVISFAPYYWRAMQCARRWFDEMNVDHLANLGKYVSAMVAGGARLIYYTNPTTLWMVMVILTSFIAMVYQLYWDFVKDWGVLNPNSKHPWLRDRLVLKNKGIYYASIVVNLVLRVVCFRTVIRFHEGVFEYDLIEFLFASLEVIRRGHWNYYRLENEHLNNVGKFRAVIDVPLASEDVDSDT